MMNWYSVTVLYWLVIKILTVMTIRTTGQEVKSGRVGLDGFFRYESSMEGTFKGKVGNNIVWGKPFGKCNEYDESEDYFLKWYRINVSRCPLNVIFRIYRWDYVENKLIDNEFITQNSALDLEDKNVYFFIHGFGRAGIHPENLAFAKAWLGISEDGKVLEKPKPNNIVIIVDWGLLSGIRFGRSHHIPLATAFTATTLYNKVFKNVRIVGRTIAHFIEFCVRNWKANPGTIRLVGHSMGAHVAGNAGAIWNEFIQEPTYPGIVSKLRSITALDPAGPFFEDLDIPLDRQSCREMTENETESREVERVLRVGSGQADLVTVEHTNPKMMGLLKAVGDIDAYVNLPPPVNNTSYMVFDCDQPHCRSVVSSALFLRRTGCSHALAVIYHVRSIRTPMYFTLNDKYYRQMTDEEIISLPSFFGHHVEQEKDLAGKPVQCSRIAPKGIYSVNVTLDGKLPQEITPSETVLLHDIINVQNLKHAEINLVRHSSLPKAKNVPVSFGYVSTRK